MQELCRDKFARAGYGLTFNLCLSLMLIIKDYLQRLKTKAGEALGAFGTLKSIAIFREIEKS